MSKRKASEITTDTTTAEVKPAKDDFDTALLHLQPGQCLRRDVPLQRAEWGIFWAWVRVERVKDPRLMSQWTQRTGVAADYDNEAKMTEEQKRRFPLYTIKLENCAAYSFFHSFREDLLEIHAVLEAEYDDFLTSC